MSSILDALKKVEEEKNARQAAERASGDTFHPEAAAAELVGDNPAELTSAIQLSRRSLIVGVIVLVTVVLGGTVGIMSMLATPSDTTQPTTSDPTPLNVASVEPPATPTFEPTPPATEISKDTAQQPPSSERVTPKETSPQPTRDTVTPTKTVDPKVSLPTGDTKPLQIAAATPKSTPTPRPDTPTTEPVSSAPTKSTVPKPRAKPVLPKDIRELPPLRSSDRARFGLEDLKINMLREPSPNRPRGSVIINLKKVYLDDLIPGTTARLVSIAAHGIAIQVGSELELYFVEN